MDARPAVTGSFWVLILFDVAEQIRLDDLRGILGSAQDGQPALKHPAADYVRFERPPVIENAGSVATKGGDNFQCHLKYFDYGVVSVEMVMDFEASWDDLVALSSRWIEEPEAERCASEVLKARLERARTTLDQPYATWLTEDYRIIHIREAWHPEGRPLTAQAMIDTRGDQIAQIVLGETIPVSEAERERVLRSSMSYYPTDLVVTGWNAALVYDTPLGAAPVIQILEYANSQLLEFRHYDVVFTEVLQRVYRSLENKTSLFGRWKLAGEAQWLNTIRLDVT